MHCGLKPFIKKYWTGILLGSAVVLAAVLRFRGLLVQSYWCDELFSATASHPNRSLLYVWDTVINFDVHPPLYHTLLWLWYRIAGFSEFTGRSLSAVTGSLGVLCLYFLGKVMYNREAGLYAAIAGSMNVFLIFYSQEVRSYSLLFLLTAVSFTFLFMFIRLRKTNSLVLYILSTVLMVYTHYFSFFILAAQAAVFAAAFFSDKKNRKKLLIRAVIAAAAVGVCILPIIPNLFKNAGMTTFWIKRPPPMFFVYYIMYYVKNYYLLGLYCFALVSAVLVFFCKKDRTPGYATATVTVLVWITAGYALPYVRSITSAPILTVRNTIIVVPALFVLIGYGIFLLKDRLLKTGFMLLVVFFSLYQLHHMRYYSKVKKEQWREVIIAANDAAGHVPMFDSVLMGFRYDTYADMLGMGFRVHTIDSLQACFDRKCVPDTFWVLDAHTDNIGESSLLAKSGFREISRIERYKARGILYVYHPPRQPGRNTESGHD